jgi:hypothetical protein
MGNLSGDETRRSVIFARTKSHLPLKRIAMTPLLSGDCERTDRISPDKPVIKGGIFLPTSR